MKILSKVIFFSIIYFMSKYYPDDTYLFDTIGQYTTTSKWVNGDQGFPFPLSTAGLQSKGYLAIDSIIRVTGVTTGYSIDIPVRYFKEG